MLGCIAQKICILVAGAVVVTAGAARADNWVARGALQNDAFSDATPPLDDAGFTHDTAFALGRRGSEPALGNGELILGGSLFHRIITAGPASAFGIDRRRWDQLELLATAEATFPGTLRGVPTPSTLGLRVGPVFGGDLGGQYVQNTWHSISGTGPTVDQGLANTYPWDHRVGVLVGVRGRDQIGSESRHGEAAASTFVVVDGQLALGQTGVTKLETAIGGSGTFHHLGASAEIALTRYHVGDPGLALPDAYGTGWNVEWRAGVHVAWSRYRVSYQYRANEAGSGEPIGVVAFELR
jgi:hypothetical protein